MDGYTKIPNDIIRCGNALSAVEFRVWCFIVSNEVGYKVSIEVAAKAIGVTKKTCINALRSLEEKGMIVKTKNAGSKLNSYTPVFDSQKWAIFGVKITPKNDKNGVKITPLSVEKLHPNSVKITPFPPYNRKDQLEENFKSAYTSAHTHEDTENLVKNISSGQWAEVMMKNHGLSMASLLWIINNAITYILASDDTLSETNIKRVAMSSAMMHKDEIRKKQRIDALKAKPITERESEFRAAIAPLVDKYGRELCNRFYRYWTETDDDGVMRFERQAAFSVARRLANFKN